MVGVDVRNDIVLVQHFAGTLGEMDLEGWAVVNARPNPHANDIPGATRLATD